MTCQVDALLVIWREPAVEELSAELERTLDLRYANVGTKTNHICWKNISKNEHRISVRSRGTITTGNTTRVRTWRMRKWDKIQDSERALDIGGLPTQ